MKKFIEKSGDRKVLLWNQSSQLYITWELVKGWRRGERKTTFNVTGVLSGADPGRSWTKDDAANQLNWILDYFYKAVQEAKKAHRRDKNNKGKALDELPVIQRVWQDIIMGKQIIPERKSRIRYVKQFKI